MQPDELAELAREIIDSGSVIPTKHFREELRQANAGIQDAMNVVHTGTISSLEPGRDPGTWKVIFVGLDFDGDQLTVVCTICPMERKLVFVTAW